MPPTRRSGRGGRRKSETPHPIDVHVGSRLKLRRLMLGISQEQLGAKLDLTFQQVQKYERGANRIGASRLWQICQVLDVRPTFFYDDMDPVRAPAMPGGFAEPPAEAFESDPLRKPETMELVGAYSDIGDAAVRRRLLEVARALAPRAEGPPDKPRRGRPKRGRP
jgi:transcriptional regulator with XRE-family HTH domain